MKKTLALILALLLVLCSAFAFGANAEEEYEWELRVKDITTFIGTFTDYILVHDDEPQTFKSRLTTLEDTDEILVINDSDKKVYVYAGKKTGIVPPHSERVVNGIQDIPFLLKRSEETDKTLDIRFKYVRKDNWELILDKDYTLMLKKNGKVYCRDDELREYPVEIFSNEILVTNLRDKDYDLEGAYEKSYVEAGSQWKFQIVCDNYDIVQEFEGGRRAIIFRHHYEYRKGNASSISFHAGDCPVDFHILIRAADENDTLEDVDFLTGLYELVGEDISPELLTDFFGGLSLTDDGMVKLVPSAETMKLLNSLPTGTYELNFALRDEEGELEPIVFTVTEPGTVPATGDSTPVILYGAVALACAAAWALSIRRRA